MSFITEFFNEKFSEALGASWRWFSVLTREEWMVVLAVGFLLGILCMRGYGSRTNY